MNFKNLNKIGITAAALMLFPLTSQAGLIVDLQKWDTMSSSFVSVASATDGDGDGFVANFYTDSDATFSTTARSGAPDVGLLTETNINVTFTASSIWKLIVSDNSYSLGNGSTTFRTSATVNPLFIDVQLLSSVDGTTIFDNALPKSALQTIETLKLISLSDPTDIVHEMIFSGGPTENANITVTTEDVPEPTTLGLLGIAVLGLGFATRRKSKLSV